MKELALWALIVFLIWFFCWGINSKLRYEIQYGSGTHLNELVVQKRPIDCDFSAAPIGVKNCDYEKQVRVATYGKDVATGRSVYSEDNGKSWRWNDGGENDGYSIYVHWRKTQQ